MLIVFLCLTKPAFMRRPWRITPCPAIHGWAFLCFMCIILQYLNSFASRLHEGVPPAAFPVSRFSYAVTGCSFVYALTLLQSKIIILFIFLQAVYNFFIKKIVQGFLMYNALREEILKYLSDMSIKQVDLMRRYNINRNTLKKYISIIHRI